MQTADGRFVLATVVDVSERRRMQDAQRSAIEGQLEFERFVAELSFQFINLPANEVIDVIRYGLRRIGQESNLDRGVFLRISPDGMLSDVITWTARWHSVGRAALVGKDTLPMDDRASSCR